MSKGKEAKVAGKKVVKKSVKKVAKAQEPTKYRAMFAETPEQQVDETQPVKSLNREVLDFKKTKPAEKISKVLSVHISIGNDDSDRSWEDFLEDVKKKIGATPYGQPGIHLSTMGGYYILDGVVCLPGDFDPKTRTFKPGKFPPPWAGGPAPKPPAKEPTPSYAVPMSVPKPAPKKRVKSADDDVEELDWDESILNDDKALGEIADQETEKLLKKVRKVAIKPAKKKTTKRATMVSGAKRGKK